MSGCGTWGVGLWWYDCIYGEYSSGRRISECDIFLGYGGRLEALVRDMAGDRAGMAGIINLKLCPPWGWPDNKCQFNWQTPGGQLAVQGSAGGVWVSGYNGGACEH